MRWFKSVLALLLSAVLCFSMAACGDDAPAKDGAGEAAPSVTEPSMTKPSEEASAEDNPYAGYVGLWSEEEVSWQYGGITLEISVKGEELSLYLKNTEGAPTCSVAEVTKTMALSELEDDFVAFDFSDDGWGNSGTIEITFTKKNLLLEVKDVEFGDSAWGFFECTCKLVRNDDAYDSLKEGDEDAPSDLSGDDALDYVPDDDVTTDNGNGDVPMYTFPEETKPTGNITVDGGFWADPSMTEEEFKESCTPLLSMNSSYSKWDVDLDRIDPYELERGKQYFKENPKDPLLSEVEEYWEKICEEYETKWPIRDTLTPEEDCNYCTNKYSDGEQIHFYEKYKTKEAFVNEQAYAQKGRELIADETEELVAKMLEYPNNYIGQHYVMLDMDYYTLNHFGEEKVIVTDARPDKNNPNILFDKYDYYLYVIFAGSDGETLYFDIATIEKLVGDY